MDYASFNLNPEVAELLLLEGASNTRNDLLIAARNPNHAVTALLLEWGADIEIRNEADRETALHIAARNPNPEVASLLVESGLSPLTKSERPDTRSGPPVLSPAEENLGRTPLHLAFRNFNTEVVVLFLEKGKVELLGTRYVHVVMALTARYSSPDVLRMLQEWGAEIYHGPTPGSGGDTTASGSYERSQSRDGTAVASVGR